MELRRFAKVQQVFFLNKQSQSQCEFLPKMRILLLLLKEMKVLDKEVRVWDVYTGLESTVKNLLTSLRAINELQNSAVRERHWQQLMNTTKVQQRSRFS